MPVTPPDDERSRSGGDNSFSDPELSSPLPVRGSLVPAASVVARGNAPPSRAVAIATRTARRPVPSDTSSSTPTPQQPQGQPLSAQQAAFVAGAAVSHAHHASDVALRAATLAEDRTAELVSVQGRANEVISEMQLREQR